MIHKWLMLPHERERKPRFFFFLKHKISFFFCYPPRKLIPNIVKTNNYTTATNVIYRNCRSQLLPVLFYVALAKSTLLLSRTIQLTTSDFFFT